MAKDRNKRRRSARDNARRRATEHKEGGGGKNFIKSTQAPEGVKYIKIKDDEPNRFAILGYDVNVDHNPFADSGDFHFERTYYVHTIPDPMSDKDRSSKIVCPNKTFGKPCPICEYLETLDWNDEDGDRKIIKAMKVKERQLWNVIDLLDEDQGAQLWDYSFHLFGKKLDSELQNADEDDDFDLFADWEGGKDLKIAWEEKKMGKAIFYEATSIHFKDRKKDYEDPTVLDLDDCIVLYTYDTIKALLNGNEAELEIDDLGSKKPKATKEKAEKKPKAEKKAKAEKVEEPEDTEDTEDTEDDEPEAEEPEEVEKVEVEPETDPEPENDDDDDDAEAEAEAETASDDAPAEEGEVCPHAKEKGFTFGVDNDKDMLCDDCDQLEGGEGRWERCFAAAKLLKAK
jgi:hypothetical protein